MPAAQLLADFFYGTSSKLKPAKYDPEGAKKLLAEAGYPNGFAITIHGPNNRYINDDKIAQAIAQFYSRAGIDAKVETMPAERVLHTRHQGRVRLHAARLGHGIGRAGLEPALAARDPRSRPRAWA